MKANTPEKLYVSDYGSEIKYNWHPERLAEKDIEYTRTDALVKQMKAWLMDNSANYMMYDPLTSSACLEVEKMIEDFKKYMKGE